MGITAKDINDIINTVCPNDEDYDKPCISPRYLRQELEQLTLEQEPTTKNNLVTLAFSKGTLKYSCKDYVVYKKEWLRNHYGAEIDIMFGDSQYKEPTTKNDLGVDGCIHKCIDKPTEDCISRAYAIQAMQDKAKKLTNEDTINGLCGAVAILFDLPSVTPQPKTGYWIDTNDNGFAYHRIYKCSHCGATVCEYPENMHESKYKYCFGCGSRNEVEE